MRLRNFFLAAAIFLSAGMVSAVAEEPAEGETRRETTHASGSRANENGQKAFTRSVPDTPDSSILTDILPQYSVIAGTEDGRSRFPIGNYYNDETPSTDEAPAFRRDDVERHVYDFASPFDNSILNGLGFTGRKDSETESDLPEANAEQPDAFQLSDNGAYSILVFEKKVFRNDQNRPKIMSGGVYDRDIQEEEVSSSPLSTPILMLITMITFCIILVIATTVGLKLKD
jgi:hypothetical protein